MMEKIKDLINFKTLITEKILKWVFVGLVCLGVLATSIGIISSWVTAIQIVRFLGAAWFMLYFFGYPILAIIGLAVWVILLRIAFEAILVRFLIYREAKEINDKTGKNF